MVCLRSSIKDKAGRCPAVRITRRKLNFLYCIKGGLRPDLKQAKQTQALQGLTCYETTSATINGALNFSVKDNCLPMPIVYYTAYKAKEPACGC